VAADPARCLTLLLIARGVQTGKLRPLPLLYQEMDGKYVVIGSKGGAPTHPGWYVNVKANPECEIRVGAKRMRARARTASGDERTRGLQKMAAMYPPYDDYQKRAGSRQIPVVVLEPIGSVSARGSSNGVVTDHACSVVNAELTHWGAKRCAAMGRCSRQRLAV
jgi:deazaflavin-dependent oxidoreductase (nitroreductase family)